MGSVAGTLLGPLRRLGAAPRRLFSSDRGRAAARTALGAIIARPLNMLLSLATTALVVRCMGMDQFGTWAVWQNFAGVLGVFALGVPLSVMNHLSTARAGGDTERLSRTVSTAFFMMAAAGAALLAGSGVWLALDPSFAGLARLDRQSLDTAGVACAAVFIAYAAVGLAAGIFDRITTSQQDGWISAGCQVVGSAISLVLVATACLFRAPLPLAAAGWAAGSLFGLAVNGVVARQRYGSWAAPRLACFSRSEMQLLLADGWQFMLLGFIGLITLQSDPLLVGIWDAIHATENGSRAVAEMAIPLRFFNIASAVILVFLSPLWPAYADAQARGDVEWSRRTLLRSLAATTAVATLLIAPATLWSRQLLAWWVGGDVSVPQPLLHAFGWWAFVTIVSYPIVMYLNGVGRLRFQLVLGLIFTTFVLPAKFAGLAWFGSAGMVAATVVVFMGLQFIPLLALALAITRPAKKS